MLYCAVQCAASQTLRVIKPTQGSFHSSLFTKSDYSQNRVVNNAVNAIPSPAPRKTCFWVAYMGANL
jgi:hypothetical protein